MFEYYLRCYVNYQQDDWTLWWLWRSTCYNTSIHSSTKMTPHEALFGVKANDPWNVEDIVPEREAPAASERIKQMRFAEKNSKSTC